MAIHRSDEFKNYAFIKTKFLKDSRISLAAKGLWAYIESQGVTSIDVHELAEAGLGSKLDISRAFKELIDHGYISLEATVPE